jgi:hypothetical protein
MNKILVIFFLTAMTKITASTTFDIYSVFTKSSSNFGRGISVSGDKMAVGSLEEVFTYELNGGIWTESVTILQPSTRTSNDYYGDVISMSGDKMAVAARMDNTKGAQSGKVYTYEWSGTEWVEAVNALSPSTIGTNDEFGRTISMSGDKMVISAYGENSWKGVVHAYKWDGSIWVQGQTLAPTALLASDMFGLDVSMSGDKLAIGATGDDARGSSSGIVYTFQWSGTSWVKDSVDLSPVVLSGSDNFGRKISMSGDKLAIGAYGDNTATGIIYTYQWSGSSWIKDSVELTGEFTGHLFGDIFSMSGDKLAVGVERADPDGMTNSGYVRTYQWNETWTEDNSSPLSPVELSDNDYFGKSVSMDGDNMGIGASGGFYAYAVPPPTASPTASPTPTPPTIASLSTEFFIKNDTLRAAAIDDFLTQLDTEYPVSAAYNVNKIIRSVDQGTLTLELIDKINNKTKLEQAFKTLRCGSNPDACDVTISYVEGRRLSDHRELTSSTIIEISFELSQALYDALDGISLDDSSFEQALADVLNVTNDEDLVIISNGGVVTVSASITTSDDENDALIDIVTALYESMSSIITALIDALGDPVNGYVTATEVDYCPASRDCSGRGTCNPENGVCDCVGDYWGINCGAECICMNGGTCIDAYCICTFPWYGKKCDSEKVCIC